MYAELAILAAFAFLYSVVAGRVERTPITGPIVFITFGFLVGSRGLASIVFAIIVLNTNLPGAQLMSMVVICTVFLSAIAHGVTANPLASALAARVAQTGESTEQGDLSHR